MPTWDDLSQEFVARRDTVGPTVLDVMRRERLAALATKTGRPVIVYAVDFLSNNDKSRMVGSDLQIGLADKQGFIEVLEKLPAGKLDMVIHSPGGDPLAAESIVALIRTKFNDVRAFVPDAAKSAATMIALGANIIAMDERGELGPIDPQMLIRSAQQTTTSPARAILDQFQMASAEIQKDPTKLPVWLPLLQQYGPSLLVECGNAIGLSKALVQKWLVDYMFSGDEDATSKAADVVEFFGEHNNFLSHGRMVSLDAMPKAVKVLDLRGEPDLRDLVWQLYTTVRLTFEHTGAYKIIENSLGQAFIRSLQQVQIAGPGPNRQPASRPAPGSGGAPAVPGQSAPNRRDRRAAQSRDRKTR